MKTFEQYNNREPQIGDVYEYGTSKIFYLLYDIRYNNSYPYKSILMKDGVLVHEGDSDIINRLILQTTNTKEYFENNITHLKKIISSDFYKKSAPMMKLIEPIVEDEDIKVLLDADDLGLL